MKKLLMFAAFAVVLCSCGSGNGKKKFDEEIVKEDRKEYKEYIRMARQYNDQGNVDAAIKQYEYAFEIESTYSDTEYSEWFNSDVAGTLESLTNPVFSLTGTHKNHEWVDLGLPSGLKWATCNVGASDPEDYGKHYVWGEIVSTEEGNVSDGRLYGMSTVDISGNSTHDAARANWGGDWRLPTKAEFEELLDSCTWEWTTQNGHNGFMVTGPNGQSIFLPPDHYSGYYWSSSPDESDTRYACILCFGKDGYDVHWFNRGYWSGVRPVLDD